MTDKEYCISVKLLTDTAKTPTKSHDSDAGIDIYSDEDQIIYPGETKAISTGVSIALPEVSNSNTHVLCLLVADRSSLGSRGISYTGGVIDFGYRGEIKICLTNLNIKCVFDQLQSDKSYENAMSHCAYFIRKGDKIAQLLIQKVCKLDIVIRKELSSTSRGDKGFGSSGK